MEDRDTPLTAQKNADKPPTTRLDVASRSAENIATNAVHHDLAIEPACNQVMLGAHAFGIVVQI